MGKIKLWKLGHMFYMVSPAEIDGSWLVKAGSEHLVVRASEYQRTWGDLQCLWCDEDIPKVFWSIRNNTPTHHDASKLYLTCGLIIPVSKLFSSLFLTIFQGIPAINNWIWSGPRGKHSPFLLLLSQNSRFSYPGNWNLQISVIKCFELWVQLFV